MQPPILDLTSRKKITKTRVKVIKATTLRQKLAALKDCFDTNSSSTSSSVGSGSAVRLLQMENYQTYDLKIGVLRAIRHRKQNKKFQLSEKKIFNGKIIKN